MLRSLLARVDLSEPRDEDMARIVARHHPGVQALLAPALASLRLAQLLAASAGPAGDRCAQPQHGMGPAHGRCEKQVVWELSGYRWAASGRVAPV